MVDLSDALRITVSGLEAQGHRLRLTAENIANADTPGYHRKTVAFEAEAGRDAAGRVEVGPVRLDQTAPESIFDPSHPLADDRGYHEGSNVNLLLEVADAREASRGYEANLKMFEQARSMSAALLDLLRR
jgi:flagellar basal-body rod protein FlgC